MTKVELKYLFSAYFTDGSCFAQTSEDRSVIDPEKRSAFYDVMQQVEAGKVISIFELTDGTNIFSVDLTDGHFEVNGVEFFMHEERDLEDFRIIFFRQHTHHFNQEHEEQAHEIVYRMGWQTTKDGKNIQRIMEFK